MSRPRDRRPHRDAPRRDGDAVRGQLSDMVGTAEEDAAQLEREAVERASEIRALAGHQAAAVSTALSDIESRLVPVAHAVSLEADRLRASITRAQLRLSAGDRALEAGEPAPEPVLPEPEPVEAEPAPPVAAPEPDPVPREPEPVEAEVVEDPVPRSATPVAGRSDIELAEMYEAATSDDRETATPGYWEAMRQAVLDEAARREDFGQAFSPEKGLKRKDRKRQRQAMQDLRRASDGDADGQV